MLTPTPCGGRTASGRANERYGQKTGDAGDRRDTDQVSHPPRHLGRALPSIATRPLVSVVVPTHDRPAMLLRALRAILDQDYEGPIECIVVFDRSPQSLPVGLAVPANRTLRALSNDRTPGLAGARNSGITDSLGSLIAFCDDDDEWLGSKLSLQVSDLLGSPQHWVSATGIYTVLEGKSRERVPPTPEISHSMLLTSRVREAHSSTLLMRRTELVDEIGLIDEDLPGSYGEDYEFLLRASQHTPILVTRRPLVRITMHTNSYFKAQWQTIAAASRYLLERHPDLRSSRTGLARIYGRLSIAEAALGNRRTACHYAAKSARLQWRQHRAYTGLAIACHLITADRAIRLAGLAGKGI